MKLKKMALLAVIASAAACSSDDNDQNMSEQPAAIRTDGMQAFIASRDSNYTAGLIEQISLSSNDQYVTKLENGALSDISVASDGTNFYQLGKSGADSVTKYNPTDTSNAVFQFSVAGDEASANPYDIIFVDPTKAYILRYDSAKIWIVNPSAQNESEFKTGEIDLVAYDDLDSIPEINGGVLVNDRLFVSMERLERGPSYIVERQGYLAVIDTTKDEEIPTGMGTADGLPGIALGVTNPTAISFAEGDGLLYVLGRGDYFGSATAEGNRFSGGLVSVNPATFETDLVIDDGDEADNSGFFFNYVPVSAGKGYLQTYGGWQDTTLRIANPITGTRPENAVAGMENVDITTLNIDLDNRLWVGTASTAGGGISIIDTSSDMLIKEVLTEFIPIKVVFIDVPAP